MKSVFVSLLFLFGLSFAHADKKTTTSTSVPAKLETATLSGGCFWGVEEILRNIKGVKDIEAGYTGGKSPLHTYSAVHTGTTGHAEAVQVQFDPSVISYEELLGYFFRLHDPTTLNQQGNDIGTQYRSAIFYHDDRQKQSAQKVKEKVDVSGKWKKKVITEVVPFEKWYKAEEEHQNYLQKNPGGYTCHFLRD